MTLSIKHRVGATLAAGAMMASVFASHAFADVTVSGNGNYSNNTANVTNADVTVVGQANVLLVSNNVSSNANTGGNQVNNNNGGGEKSVTTGNATNNVTVKNIGGDNTANVTDDCGCPQNGDVKIKNNGNHSNNTVNKTTFDLDVYLQGNVLAASNNVNTRANTGHNEVKNNNGKGKKTVTTGKATNNVTVKNKGGNNTLNVNP